MRSKLYLVVLSSVLASFLTMVSAACSSGSNPAAPSGVGSGSAAAAVGDIVIDYNRPDYVLDSLPPSGYGVDCGKIQVTLSISQTWPGGYSITEGLPPSAPLPAYSAPMDRVGERRYRFVLRNVPKGSNLPISLIDGCLLDAHNMSHDNMIAGLHANGTRLKEGQFMWVYFDHSPSIQPSVMAR